MFGYDDASFRCKVNDSLNTVKRILDVHRNPRLAEDVDHQYGDKYLLMEQMANTALIGQLNVMTYFGLTTEILQAIDQSKPTALRFQASTSCTFLKEEIVEIPSPRTEQQQEEEEHVESSLFGNSVRATNKQVVQQVPEYHWKVDVVWEVSLYVGSDVGGRSTLKRRYSSMVLIIQSKNESPLPQHEECKAVDLSLMSLLKFVNTQKMVSTFAIDRDSPTTKTPCQNEQVTSMVTMMNELEQWTDQVRQTFVRHVLVTYLRQRDPAAHALILLCRHRDALSYGEHENFFVPILPVMETFQSSRTTNPGSPPRSVLTVPAATVTETLSLTPTPILSVNDMHTILNEQVCSIDERIASLRNKHPSSESTTIWSVEEVILVVLCPYSKMIGTRFVEAVNYVESMLRNQLVAAIGKHVQLSDIEQFVRYHNARLLNPAPQSFCHAIRLSGHDPCGMLSIESTNADGTKIPIQTLCREINSSSSSTVKVPLNSGTTVELSGPKYLHGWIHHRFGKNQGSFELIARARQFSAFLLVVGTMSGSDHLEPIDAIIVQKKDEVLIPLILDEIPTSKEFKDAIKVLSPEQQQFAKSFRSMQLASSVMGICVIQIKPQLEVLLGLGQGSLTKEMQLTQDLMELFIEYQVPSDLVSYDGIDPEASRNDRVASVRGQVKSVFDVINATRHKELQDKLSKDLAQLSEVARSQGNCGENDGAGTYDGTRIRRAAATTQGTALKGFVQGDAELEGEIYIRPDGKKVPVRGNNKSLHNFEIISKPDGTRVRRIRRLRLPDEPSISHSTDANRDLLDSTNDLDFTIVPKLLDSTIEACLPYMALRSTTIKLHNKWQRNRQADLLSQPITSFLECNGSIKTERNQAFDLLDALSRSGSLSIAFSELHVIVAVTHSFEKDVIETIVQDNINPIEKLEMSTLLVGSVIHGVAVPALLRDESALNRLTPLL